MIKNLIIKSYSLVRKRPFLYIVMLIRVVNMIVMLYAAGLTADLFSMITSSSFEGNTFQIIIILLITYSFTLLLQYFSFISKQRYEKETHINVKKMIMEKILREYKYISANPGKLTEIITNDSGNVLHLVEAFFELVIEISSVLISFILLVRINVWLSLLILAIMLMYVLFTICTGKKIKNLTQNILKVSDEYYAIVRGISGALKYIRIASSREYHEKRFLDNLYHTRDLVIKRERVSWSLSFMGTAFDKVWILGGLIVSIYLVGFKGFSASVVIRYILYGKYFCTALFSLFNQSVIIKQNAVSAERALEIVYDNEDKLIESEKAPTDCKEITLDNLKYTYMPESESIFELNEKIVPGMTLITGRNGGGKSTLMNILGKVLMPCDGNVFLSDIQISCISEENFRKNISYMPQGDVLFDISIRDNILCDITLCEKDDFRIKEVCTSIGIYDDIMKTKDGFDTVISELRDFSYGQKKKMLLARALLRDAKVYLFDEPLEGIDAESALKIRDVLCNLSKERIVIIATHKPDFFPKDVRRINV